MTHVTLSDFLSRYIETQEGTIESVKEQLTKIKSKYPTLTGFVMYQAQDLSSSWAGQRVIMPIGPDNTFKDIDSLPPIWSPRGLASDMSVPLMVTTELP